MADQTSTEGSGTPKWVKISAGLAATLVLLVAVMLIAGGGKHGPGRHNPASHSTTTTAAVDATGGHTASGGGN